MRLVRMDPPGTHCHRQAIYDFIDKLDVRHFVEVGIGDGGLAKRLLQRGMTGAGLERSRPAVIQARQTLGTELSAGRFELVEGDLLTGARPASGLADLGLALMVMEHVPDDVGFAQGLMALVRPGGFVLLSVPGRRDRWSFEDETVGHLRRYERPDLVAVLERAGAQDIVVRSVSVPVANLLQGLGNYLARRAGESRKLNAGKLVQTDTSGIREIPFKTVFPRWCRIILNPVTLYPLFVLQRLFYRGDLGIELMALARVPDPRHANR